MRGNLTTALRRLADDLDTFADLPAYEHLAVRCSQHGAPWFDIESRYLPVLERVHAVAVWAQRFGAPVSLRTSPCDVRTNIPLSDGGHAELVTWLTHRDVLALTAYLPLGADGACLSADMVVAALQPALAPADDSAGVVPA